MYMCDPNGCQQLFWTIYIIKDSARSTQIMHPLGEKNNLVMINESFFLIILILTVNRI